MTGGEHYLGDGLYASFDGGQVVLRAPREGGDHWIALEPATMTALMAFLAELDREQRPKGAPVYRAVVNSVR